MISCHLFLASVQTMTYAREYQDKGNTRIQGRYIRGTSGILTLLKSIRKRKISMKRRMKSRKKWYILLTSKQCKVL